MRAYGIECAIYRTLSCWRIRVGGGKAQVRTHKSMHADQTDLDRRQQRRRTRSCWFSETQKHADWVHDFSWSALCSLLSWPELFVGYIVQLVAPFFSAASQPHLARYRSFRSSLFFISLDIFFFYFLSANVARELRTTKNFRRLHTQEKALLGNYTEMDIE